MQYGAIEAYIKAIASVDTMQLWLRLFFPLLVYIFREVTISYQISEILNKRWWGKKNNCKKNGICIVQFSIEILAF